MNSLLYALPEDIKHKDYALATYYIELGAGVDVMAKAVTMAVGQTVGTWVEVPGVTDEMRKNHMGKVVNILDAPPHELSAHAQDGRCAYFIQIAYPTINFGPQFPMLFTTLLGNDASTSAQVKLVDLQLPESFVSAFKGPKFGIEGLRRLAGVPKGPLLLNMIKPCTGLSPEAGAKIFYETALGGADFIKDDELLANPPFNRAARRVKAYHQAAQAAYEKTGKYTVYIVNVTDSAANIMDTVKAVLDAGAKAIMMCFSAVGYSLFQQVCESVDLPVLGHYAATGASNEGVTSGLSSHLSVGKFPRMAGADLVVMNTPYGGYPLRRQKYLMTAQQLTLPFYHLKPSMPIAGGGVHPGMTQTFLGDLGPDMMLAVGGAIQGHPMGATAGVIAMRQSIEAAMAGVTAAQYAAGHPELAAALNRFGAGPG